jgi:hypothetical protein
MFYGLPATFWFKNYQNWLENKDVTLYNKLKKELFFPVFNAKMRCASSYKKCHTLLTRKIFFISLRNFFSRKQKK